MILQGTVVWPHLFEPTQFEQNEPKFELNLLIRKDDEQMDDIRAVIEELVNDKMKGSCSPEQLPIKDCDQRDDSRRRLCRLLHDPDAERQTTWSRRHGSATNH